MEGEEVPRMLAMTESLREELRRPRPGSGIAEAQAFGIDLTQTLDSMVRLSPTERLKRLQTAVTGLNSLQRARKP